MAKRAKQTKGQPKKQPKKDSQESKTEVAIRIANVSKRYRRFAQSHKFLTLKSAFVRGNLFKALRPDEVFTALDDVSLEIMRGETFGVIGSNGAGKSTLMKIVAGTTKPTEGEVEIRGKISALIELGAGFHPEISGRENVFINGIMLGLTRQEIVERFDEIVAFAELEEFIDMPVRNYSSGMYMRLGFSVAIHVDPDLLVIDEVLAVGDEAFVHKCLDKIGEFKRRNKTILLVTHGMETVRRLCDRAVWIRDGKIAALGDPVRVVDKYLDWVAEHEEEEMTRTENERIARAGDGVDEEGLPAPDTGDGPGDGPYEPGRWGSGGVTLEQVRFLDADGNARHVFTTGDPMTLELAYKATEPVEDFVFGIGIFNANGVACYGTNTDIERFVPDRLADRGTVKIAFDSLQLIQGTYYLDVAVHRKDGTAYDYHRGLYSFRLSSHYGDVGVARLPHSWSFGGGLRWKEKGGMPAAGSTAGAEPGDD